MKKIILALSLFAIAMAGILSSCHTAAEKIEVAKENVLEANQDLEIANKESVEELDRYRAEAVAKIAFNEKSLAEFKKRIENEKQTERVTYLQKINELEQKNTDVKKKMDDYKVQGKEQWESFKTEFSHDMDQLGQTIKDFTIKNTK